MKSPPSQPHPVVLPDQENQSSPLARLLQHARIHPLIRALLGIVLGTALGVLCASIIALPIRLIGDKLMAFVLPGSAEYTGSYFQCAVIGCSLAALMMWVLAGLYGTRSRVLMALVGGIGLVVAGAGAWGAALVADMVAIGAAQEYYSVARVAHGINNLVQGGDSGAEIADGVSTYFEEAGDALYYELSEEMMWAAFVWVGLCCLGLMAGALLMRFTDRKERGGRQFDLSTMGALAGYLAVEWFSGGKTVAYWGLFGLLLGLCVWIFGSKTAGGKTVRKIVLGSLLAGLGFDFFFGDDSLLWKVTLAVSVWLSSWIVSVATLRDAQLNPRALKRARRKEVVPPPPLPLAEVPRVPAEQVSDQPEYPPVPPVPPVPLPAAVVTSPPSFLLSPTRPRPAVMFLLPFLVLGGAVLRGIVGIQAYYDYKFATGEVGWEEHLGMLLGSMLCFVAFLLIAGRSCFGKGRTRHVFLLLFLLPPALGIANGVFTEQLQDPIYLYGTLVDLTAVLLFYCPPVSRWYRSRRKEKHSAPVAGYPLATVPGSAPQAQG